MGDPPPPSHDPEGAIAHPDPRQGGPRLRRLQVLARVMDAQVAVPFTRIRFGVDALAGLVPGLGDVAGALVSGWVILESARLGASRGTLVRMLGNVAAETLAGLVPVLGDLFDVVWRSNQRNVELLERHLADPERMTRASRIFLATILLTLVSVMFVTAVASLWLFQALLRALA